MRTRYARRQPGRCQDCGWERPCRWFVFWLNGYRMRLCAACEHTYAKRGEPERA